MIQSIELYDDEIKKKNSKVKLKYKNTVLDRVFWKDYFYEKFNVFAPVFSEETPNKIFVELFGIFKDKKIEVFAKKISNISNIFVWKMIAPKLDKFHLIKYGNSVKPNNRTIQRFYASRKKSHC